MNIKELYNVISKNVRFYRMNNFKYGYLTQEKLARLSGINLNLIRNIEEGRKELVISLTVINDIANTLDIPIYKFFMERVNKT